MRSFLLALALIVVGAIGISSAQAAAVAPSQLGVAAQGMGVVEKTQYYYGGHAHCWYGSGWHGPGWYWCGYRWRRGYGWGGPRGWNNWVYSGWGPGPAVVVAPVPACRWVNERVVRPNGVVVVRRVRVCR